MKKIICLMFALLLVACSANNQNQSSKLRVGMECNYAPFNWTQVEASDYAVAISSVDYCDGYDVQIARRIADSLGRELEIVKTDWDGLIPALNNNQLDLIIAGMTDTPERRESVNFTTPYYESDMVVVVRKDSELVNIKSIQELSGYTVLGQSNTTYDEIIDQIDGVIHATPLATYPRMILSLQSKEVDAITAELPVATTVVAANPDLAIVTFEAGNGFDVDTSVSIAVKKENSDLFNDVQKALDNISEQDRLNIMAEASVRQPAIEE